MNTNFENNAIEIDGLDEIELDNTPVDDLESENINLIFVGIDGSGSMYPFENDMKACLQEFKSALIDSKEADEILIARADFSNYATVGGYKKISEFETDFKAFGSTAMFDTICDGVDKLTEYRKFLRDQGVRVKAVFAIFSDGEDNASKKDRGDAKQAVKFLNDEEITTAFISFGGTATSIAQNLGFRNILDVKSSASELRKSFNCLSKSVIESSKSVVADEDDFFQI